MPPHTTGFLRIAIALIAMPCSHVWAQTRAAADLDLLGGNVVTVDERLGTRSQDGRPVARQGPSVELEPQSAEELLALLADIGRITVRACHLKLAGEPFPRVLPEESVPIGLAVEHQATVIQDLRRGAGSGIMLQAITAELQLQLRGNRFVRASMDIHSDQALIVGQAGSFTLSAAGAAAIRRALDESVRATQQRFSIVHGSAELVQWPRDVGSLCVIGISDIDPAVLAEFLGLRQLDVSGCSDNLSPEQFEVILGLPGLDSLVVRSEQVRGDRLQRLADSERWRSLIFDTGQTRLLPLARDCVACHMPPKAKAVHGDIDLAALGRIQTLREFGVRGAPLPDGFERALGELPLLERLDFDNSDVAKFSPAAIPAMPVLRELSLSRARGLTAKSLRPLSRLKYLRRLDLRWVQGLDPADLRELALALPDCDVKLTERPR